MMYNIFQSKAGNDYDFTGTVIDMVYDFGLRLRELRKSRHWSQRQLAKELQLSASAISGYENNLKIPSATVISEMASIFCVSANYLLGIEEYDKIHVETLTYEQKQIIEMLFNEFRRANQNLKYLSREYL